MDPRVCLPTHPMRILAEGTKTYPDDPSRHFDFGRFADRADDFWLAAGHFDFETVRPLSSQTVVYLDLEEPNRFFSTDPAFNRHAYEDSFHHIFTLCPYTAAWLNRRQGRRRRTPVFFPFNERFIPEPREKPFDVIYTGHLVAPAVSRLADAIAPFNYRLVSQSDDPRVTDRSASYVQKLDLHRAVARHGRAEPAFPAAAGTSGRESHRRLGGERGVRGRRPCGRSRRRSRGG